MGYFRPSFNPVASHFNNLLSGVKFRDVKIVNPEILHFTSYIKHQTHESTRASRPEGATAGSGAQHRGE